MFLLLIFFILKITTIHANLCPILALPKHGYVVNGYCERQVGSFCGIACLTGYRLIQGDSFRECQEDGTWSGEAPICEEIRCSPLKSTFEVIQDCSPEQNNTNYIFGTKCRARCNETGYRLVGPDVRECLTVGRWSGYEQFCIVSTEIKAVESTSAISTHSSTVMTSKSYDYTNYALTMHSNNTGIILTSFPSSAFTIIFWFYLENGTNAVLLSLQEENHKKQFEIVVRQNKLVFHFSLHNQTQPTLIKIPLSRWIHFAWTFSNKSRQSYVYIDGARQQTFDFGIIQFDFQNVSSLVLFDRFFHGSITRLEIWNEMLIERQLLVSYRDCRKQNGNFFSWSKVSDTISIKTSHLKSSGFCLGCSEPASIHGGSYHVSDYEIASSVTYKCNYGYELIGVHQAVCLVTSEWYPLPPTCKHNPCTSECELCEKKTGICLKQQTKFNSNQCDPPCDDDEECIDGECTWTNNEANQNSDPNENICNPSCPNGVQCLHRQCQYHLAPYCPASCRPDQVCIDGRCGCSKGLCENNRLCYEVCEVGERCFNSSCSCGVRGKCPKGELCLMDLCMCGTKRGGCRSHEQCLNGRCICKTNFCDQCENACKSNEICLHGKCVCKENCAQAYCPFPCLHGGRCSGFYQCTCRQGWQGHRCEQHQRNT